MVGPLISVGEFEDISGRWANHDVERVDRENAFSFLVECNDAPSNVRLRVDKAQFAGLAGVGTFGAADEALVKATVDFRRSFLGPFVAVVWIECAVETVGEFGLRVGSRLCV